MSYFLLALMILLAGLALISRIPKSLTLSLWLLTATFQAYAIGVGYGWSPPLAFLAISGTATLGFLASGRLTTNRAGLHQALFLCGLISQITLFIEYPFAFKAGAPASQFFSAFIRWSFAGLPGAVLSISYGCMGLERALSSLATKVASSLKIVRPRRFWVIFIIFVALSALWNVYKGPTALAYSQSALSEQSMVASGSYTPIATGPLNQSSYPSSMPDPFARLRTEYKSQPLKLYDYVNDYSQRNPDSKILVVIGDVWIHTVRARVLLYGMDNVEIVQAPEDWYSFCAMMNPYDLVLLYGEYYGTYYTQVASTLPLYYVQILANQTDVRVLRILEWQEGYLYRLERSGNCVKAVFVDDAMLTHWSFGETVACCSLPASAFFPSPIFGCSAIRGIEH